MSGDRDAVVWIECAVFGLVRVGWGEDLALVWGRGRELRASGDNRRMGEEVVGRMVGVGGDVVERLKEGFVVDEWLFLTVLWNGVGVVLSGVGGRSRPSDGLNCCVNLESECCASARLMAEMNSRRRGSTCCSIRQRQRSSIGVA